MTMNAIPILEDRFWILEEDGIRVGTLSFDNDRYMFNNMEEIKYFDTEGELRKVFGEDFLQVDRNSKNPQKTHYILGYPTSVKPYNVMHDVHRSLPLFTKSKKSKSLYCAGYFLIEFNNGWVRSFCPKLITVERYNHKGPFRTEQEIRDLLGKLSNEK